MRRARWVFVAAAVLVAACDPVQDGAIDALGGEAPGVRRGPLHRPGQPCLLCHDGALGDPPAFSVAGTVYLRPSDATGVNGATVSLLDANGSAYKTTTNTAGNFYVTPTDWTPTFPITVKVAGPTGVVVPMRGDVGRSGGCATCHVAPAGPTSPGPVSVELDDGGTPP